MRRENGKRLPNAVVGLIAAVLIFGAFYFAFAKKLPWTGGYQLQAVFRNAQNLTQKSPVRIAGVNVGKVTAIEGLPESNAALITMEIDDAGLPIHEDARLQLRPRLFLEGNYFIDLKPGSPSSPPIPDGGDPIPMQQTYNTVQIDEILTTLQADVRGNLQLVLREVGDALQKHGGAAGLREAFKTGGPAFKNSALVTEALLGTKVGDLSGLITNFDRVAQSLNKNQTQLQDLVTNLKVVTGSFAAEDVALRTSIHTLPGLLDASKPALASLNASFPSLRAFAREALPGVQSTTKTLQVSTPFIRQLRGLVSGGELRGLTADLRPTIPQLARLTKRTIPFMEQARALSNCFVSVVIPWSNDRVITAAAANEPAAGTVAEETGYGLVGINGESRSGDGNGQYVRVIAGSGTNIVQFPAGDGLRKSFGLTDTPILGADPPLNSSKKTKFKPGVPCENQEPPNLDGGGNGAPPTQRQLVGSNPSILHNSLADTDIAALSKVAAEMYMTEQEISTSSGNEKKDLLGELKAKAKEFKDMGGIDKYQELAGALTGTHLR